MTFVGNNSTKVLVAGGAAAVVVVPVPRVIDSSGNGYSGNLFSHYMVLAMSSTGSSSNASLVATGGPALAINPANSTVSVTSSATADLFIIFGKMD